MSDQVTSAPEAGAEQKNPNLNIADLVNVLQVMKSCASRGAFRVEEMSAVGGLYDRLYAFLVSTGAVKVATDEQEAQAPADTPKE